MLFGEELVQEGIITTAQLDEALAKQKQGSGKKIGEVLLELGYIDIEQFTKIIEKQLKDAGLQK